MPDVDSSTSIVTLIAIRHTRPQAFLVTAENEEIKVKYRHILEAFEP